MSGLPFSCILYAVPYSAQGQHHCGHIKEISLLKTQFLFGRWKDGNRRNSGKNLFTFVGELCDVE